MAQTKINNNGVSSDECYVLLLVGQKAVGAQPRAMCVKVCGITFR